MCRWIAYSGQPVRLAKLVVSPSHSLIDQSQNTKMNYSKSGALLQTNGDGYGAGWYSQEKVPIIVKGKDPIWNNANFKNICSYVDSGLFMAHVRLTTTGGVHRENSHPFGYENWLFQHNGEISDFPTVRRDLQMDIEPALYPHLKGTTDSETFFLLALTYGLKENPKQALQKMVQRLRKVSKEHKTEGAINLSCVLSDGQNLYTIRYGENVQTNTQFFSQHNECLSDFSKDCTPLPENSIVVVSEPLDQLSKKWTKVPGNSYVKIGNDEVSVEQFMED